MSSVMVCPSCASRVESVTSRYESYICTNCTWAGTRCVKCSRVEDTDEVSERGICQTCRQAQEIVGRYLFG